MSIPVVPSGYILLHTHAQSRTQATLFCAHLVQEQRVYVSVSVVSLYQVHIKDCSAHVGLNNIKPPVFGLHSIKSKFS